MSSVETGPQSEQKDWGGLFCVGFGVGFFEVDTFLVAGRSKKGNFVLFSFQPRCIGLLQQPATKGHRAEQPQVITSVKRSITSSLPALISIRANASLQF